MPYKTCSYKNPFAGSDPGFSLIEMLIAVAVLTLGLLAAGQLICAAMSSRSLSRSKQTAAVVAQDKLEYLADLYRQNPSASELVPGNHGPKQIRVLNPINNITLNQYNITWTASEIPDPRPGKKLEARQVTVTVTPIQPEGTENIQAPLNKVMNITTIFSSMTPGRPR